jgi:CspA family cold shock protein
MAGGTVRWFSEEKGCGFIAPDGGGEDIFVHNTAIEGVGHRSLREGERVSYEPGESRRGEIATDVRRLD